MLVVMVDVPLSDSKCRNHLAQSPIEVQKDEKVIDDPTERGTQFVNGEGHG